jgi:Uma2 family endonuclease
MHVGMARHGVCDARPVPVLSAYAAARQTAHDRRRVSRLERGYELSEGEVFAMAAERLGHARTKFAVQLELLRGIGKAGLDCHMVPDSATVRVSERTAYEPDALVYCGPQRPDSETEVPNPTVVVEVLPPGTYHIDNAVKLTGYFALPSVCHYLILDIEKRLVIHHARAGGDAISTRIVREGEIALDPPGIRIDCESCFRFG